VTTAFFGTSERVRARTRCGRSGVTTRFDGLALPATTAIRSVAAAAAAAIQAVASRVRRSQLERRLCAALRMWSSVQPADWNTVNDPFREGGESAV
jgi:hypothetical protein